MAYWPRLYEILVPTKYGDTLQPISTKHHKEWDKLVRKLTGGLTILTPGKGQWIYEGSLYEEKVIPVRIMCEEKTINKIIFLTLRHYRQKAVMFYQLTDNVQVVYADQYK